MSKSDTFYLCALLATIQKMQSDIASLKAGQEIMQNDIANMNERINTFETDVYQLREQIDVIINEARDLGTQYQYFSEFCLPQPNYDEQWDIESDPDEYE